MKILILMLFITGVVGSMALSYHIGYKSKSSAMVLFFGSGIGINVGIITLPILFYVFSDNTIYEPEFITTFFSCIIGMIAYAACADSGYEKSGDRG